MANKRLLPRELKMRREIEKLEEETQKLAEENLSVIEELRQVQQIRDSAVHEIDILKGYIGNLKDRISDLEDFKSFARYALPNLEPRRTYQAINSSNEADRQEH